NYADTGGYSPISFTVIRSSSEPASDTSLAVAPAQQNKSTIVRLRSFVCIADDAPEKRVNMSSPECYILPYEKTCKAGATRQNRIDIY
ncbi:TPA: hypothetical protein ACNCHT_005376, partial [Escherichia coli]